MKDTRLAVRLTSEQRALVDAAAAAQGRTVTEFTVATLTDHARDVLADRRVFPLDEQQWKAFNALLDAPPRDLSSLAELLSEKAPWEG